MRILVTGGAGFIGSHLCEALIAEGNSVTALDDLSTGNTSNLDSLKQSEKFQLVQGSVLNEDLTRSLVEKADYIFHFAAAVGVQKILKDPIGSLRTNILGSENVMSSAAREGKPTIIASTSEIYGKNDSAPLSEDSDRILGSPLKARWTYSEAKAIDESIARALFERDGWQVKIVRLFNTVGPRQSSAYGMVIPRFFKAALNQSPIEVYGDGTQRRVFCHVGDAISGILSLSKIEDGYGEAFNLGGFEETSILDLAERIKAKCESNSEIKLIPYDKLGENGFVDMQRRVPNTSKLSELTGWRATKTLEEILDDTLLELRSR